MMNIDSKTEVERSQLAQHQHFNTESAFLLFTESTLNKLTKEKLQEGLNLLGCACSTLDAERIIARYDADVDSKLSFWEFSNLVLGRDSPLDR